MVTHVERSALAVVVCVLMAGAVKG